MEVKDAIVLLRKHNVLSSWSIDQIVTEIVRAIKEKTIAFTVDENNRLSSICITRWHDNCCMHVVAIAGKKGSLKLMIEFLKTIYPSVTKLTAERHGKLVEYQVKDL